MSLIRILSVSTLLFVNLSVFAEYSGDAQASAPAAKAPPSGQSVESFVPVLPDGRDCFPPGPDSFDRFMTFLQQKNQDNPLANFRLQQAFSRADFERFQQQLHCETFLYQVDDATVLGYLVMPKHAAAQSLPVMIYNRGGNGGFGALRFANVYQQLLPLAEAGYVVLASNYRGSHNPRQAQAGLAHEDEFGGADVADVLALKSMLGKIPAANPKRVAMMGHSRGGMQTWLAARQWPELSALIIVAGVTDLARELTQRPEMAKVFAARIPNYAKTPDAVLQQRSVSSFLGQIRADLPVLIIHGDQDERVHVSQAQQIDALLSARQQPHQLLIYPGGDHSLRAQMPQIRDKITEFVNASWRD